MVAAVVAVPRRPFLDLVELPRLIACRTMGVVPIWRVSLAPEEFEAGSVIRKVPHELHQGVRGLRERPSFRRISVCRGHVEQYSMAIPCVGVLFRAPASDRHSQEAEVFVYRVQIP